MVRCILSDLKVQNELLEKSCASRQVAQNQATLESLSIFVLFKTDNTVTYAKFYNTIIWFLLHSFGTLFETGRYKEFLTFKQSCAVIVPLYGTFRNFLYGVCVQHMKIADTLSRRFVDFEYHYLPSVMSYRGFKCIKKAAQNRKSFLLNKLLSKVHTPSGSYFLWLNHHIKSGNKENRSVPILFWGSFRGRF